MNTDNLHKIFANYIRKFELINSPEHNENYKWEIAAKFHALMDPDAPDFLVGLSEARKLSSNLIDGVNRYCFSALVSCAPRDEEFARQLFRDLFAEDGGDLTLRQARIDAFIAKANEFVAKYHSPNGVFINDQRSAMGYLFLNDPDRHYLYKATEAANFASCIEFYDDWGTGKHFLLDVYHRMCDLLVEEIKKNQALVDTTHSRYIDMTGKPILGLHPDANYHILAFDIIYGAPEFRYNFYEGISFSTITARARKLYQDKREKARELYTAVEAARTEAALWAEARDYYTSLVPLGAKVVHKAFGEGTIVECGENSVKVEFRNGAGIKSFVTTAAFDRGFFCVNLADFQEKRERYHEVVRRSGLVDTALKRAEDAFGPYEDYLE